MAKQLTVGSLFSGIGGIELGLEWTGGFKTVWQVEIDDYARRVLAKHWPDVRRWDDVRTFPPEPRGDCEVCYGTGKIGGSVWGPCPKCDWRCDIIVGGDPCQENSAARTGDYTTQQSLGGEFIRVVAAICPWLVLRENPAVTRKDAPWPWWRMRSALESLGYACVPFRLRACCLGAQHQRERMFLFGELANANADSDRLEGRPCGELEESEEKSTRLLEAPHWPNIPTSRGFSSRAGIPNYVDEMRAIGNSVCPQVAQWIGERILEAAQAELFAE